MSDEGLKRSHPADLSDAMKRFVNEYESSRDVSFRWLAQHIKSQMGIVMQVRNKNPDAETLSLINALRRAEIADEIRALKDKTTSLEIEVRNLGT